MKKLKLISVVILLVGLGAQASSDCENYNNVCLVSSAPPIAGSLQLQGIVSSFYSERDLGLEYKPMSTEDYRERIKTMAERFNDEKDKLEKSKYQYEVNLEGVKTLVDMTASTIQSPGSDIVKAGVDGIYKLERLKIDHNYQIEAKQMNAEFNSAALRQLDLYFEDMRIDTNQLSTKSNKEFRGHVNSLIGKLSGMNNDALDALSLDGQQGFQRRYEKTMRGVDLEVFLRREKQHEDLKKGQENITNTLEKSLEEMVNTHQKNLNQYSKLVKEEDNNLGSLAKRQDYILVETQSLINAHATAGKEGGYIVDSVLFLKAAQLNSMTATEVMAQLDRGLDIDDLVEKKIIPNKKDYVKEIKDAAKVESVVAGMTRASKSFAALAELGGNLGMHPGDVDRLNRAAGLFSGIAQLSMGAMSQNPLALLSGLNGIAGAFGGRGKSAETARHEALMEAHKKTQEMLATLGEAMSEGFKAMQDNFNNVVDNQIAISKNITMLTQLTVEKIAEVKTLQLYSIENQSYMMSKNYKKSCNDFVNHNSWSEVQRDYDQYRLLFSSNEGAFLKCKTHTYDLFTPIDRPNPIGNEFYLQTYLSRQKPEVGDLLNNYRKLFIFFRENQATSGAKRFESALSQLFLQASTFDGVNQRFEYLNSTNNFSSKTEDLFIERSVKLPSIMGQLLTTGGVVSAIEMSLSFLPFVEISNGEDSLPGSLDQLVEGYNKEDQAKSNRYVTKVLDRSHSILQVHLAQLRLLSGDVALPLFYKALTGTESAPQKDKALYVMHENVLISENVLRYTLKKQLNEVTMPASVYKFMLAGTDPSELKRFFKLPEYWTFLLKPKKEDKPPHWVAVFSYKSIVHNNLRSFEVELPTPEAINRGTFVRPSSYSQVVDLKSRIEQTMLLRNWSLSSTKEDKRILMGL